MKKIISLLLVLVLGLSLCACGVPEQYRPLLEHLENQNYEGIRNEMMVLSPDYVVEQEQMAINAEKLEKYQGLIDMLDAEDYEGALADVENRIPVPEYEVIEITMENWDEYFEIVPDHYWTENAFGEGERLYMGFSLFLKDVFIPRLSHTGNSNIACTVSFDAREKTLEFNWKEKTFAEVPYNPMDCSGGITSTGMDGGRWPDDPFEEECYITPRELNDYNIVPPDKDGRSNLFWIMKSRSDRGDIYNFYFCENFEMVRITGTIELVVE